MNAEIEVAVARKCVRSMLRQKRNPSRRWLARSGNGALSSRLPHRLHGASFIAAIRVVAAVFSRRIGHRPWQQFDVQTNSRPVPQGCISGQCLRVLCGWRECRRSKPVRRYNGYFDLGRCLTEPQTIAAVEYMPKCIPANQAGPGPRHLNTIIRADRRLQVVERSSDPVYHRSPPLLPPR
jgi:hypothetical protein